MRKRARWLWRLGIGGLAVVILAFVVRSWVIPAVIVAQIRKQYHGHVAIRGWWIGRASAGVTGLTLHESPSARSPMWATAERVTTDLSLGKLLRGRLTPREIRISAPRIRYRIARDGRPLTRPPFQGSDQGPTPVVIIQGGRLTLAQVGRAEMVVASVDGRLEPDGKGARLRARSGDAGWGRPVVVGAFGPGFGTFTLRLTADPLPADREKTARIPFVDEQVWREFVPVGPVRVVVEYTKPERRSAADVKTTVDFERATILLPSLELIASAAVGRLIYQDKVVRLEGMRGSMVGGRVAVDGTMDFHGRASRYALTVGLEGVDVAAFPVSFGLDALSPAGRLTGRAGLRMLLDDRGLDLTGSNGQGTIEGASLQGVPLGRLELGLRGEGLRPGKEGTGTRGGAFVPQWVGADFAVRDVELDRAVALVRARGGVREVPVSGRLGLRLSLRLPLGSLGDVATYCGEGTADLAGASVGGVSLGRLSGRFDLARGVLDVSEVRGRLVDRPGRDARRPEPTEPAPRTGPLPAGGFRGRFRANLAARGHAEAEFEGERLPLGALGSPEALPLAGALSVRAAVRGESLSETTGWTGSGRVAGAEVVYRSSRFRDVAATLALDRGRLSVPGLAARLDGRALTARGDIALAAPHAFSLWLDGAGLPLADLLALVSATAARGEVAGTVAARAEASGTLRPWRLETRGRARVDRAEAARIPVGDVPLEWESQGEAIVVSAREVQRYGGRLSAEARVPVRGDRPVTGTVTLSHVDTAQLSAEVPGALRLTGVADGHARFRLPLGRDDPPAEGEARLSAHKMTVEGVPARALEARVVLHDGVPKFEARAEGLGGTFTVKGAGTSRHDGGGTSIDADLRAVDLRLPELWETLGMAGSLAQAGGRAALTARLRTRGTAHALSAEGSAEVRDLKWGDGGELGHVRAGFNLTPDCYRVGNLEGSLWEGMIQGEFRRQARGRDPAQYSLALRLEKVSLARAFGVVPELGRRFEGFASFEAQGRSAGSFRGQGALRVAQGRVNHVPIHALAIPVAWGVRPEEGFRGAVQVQKAVARIGAGRLEGNATFRLGRRRDFSAELTLDDIDMRIVSRAEGRVGQPLPGRIDGIINLAGPDVARSQDYTGRIDLDLTKTALGDVPILDEIDRALGSARGAVFDEGDAHAQIARREVHVERLTLVGPLAQLHASGTIGFDSRVDLRVLVNTNDGFPESGQVMVGRLSSAGSNVRLQDQTIDRMADFLSSRLVKFRITGTLAHPTYNLDRSIHVDRIAFAFFVEAMRLRNKGATR